MSHETYADQTINEIYMLCYIFVLLNITIQYILVQSSHYIFCRKINTEKSLSLLTIINKNKPSDTLCIFLMNIFFTSLRLGI